jgi:hypothetical protein
VLWRFYMHYELASGDARAALRVYFRAVRAGECDVSRRRDCYTLLNSAVVQAFVARCVSKRDHRTNLVRDMRARVCVCVCVCRIDAVLGAHRAEELAEVLQLMSEKEIRLRVEAQ